MTMTHGDEHPISRWDAAVASQVTAASTTEGARRSGTG